MIRGKKFSMLVLLLIWLTLVTRGFGQVKVSGVVMDSSTGETISGASVTVDGTTVGASCDSLGYFSLILSGKSSPFSIRVSAVGYLEFKAAYQKPSENLVIEMQRASNTIDAVEVAYKGKYNNKNPTVELIRQVIQHKKINRLENQPKLSFKQYDKLQLGMLNPSEKYRKGLGSMNFFFQNVDTISSPGNRLLTIFMQEQMSDVYSKNDPKAYKKHVTSLKQTEFDERYVNNHNIQSYISYLFQDIELYDENVFLINKLFLSPIANNAPLFYKYYPVDTVTMNGDRYVRLNFEPRNKEDLLLSGTLLISTDDRYTVRLAELRANKETNLNWVNDMNIKLHYKPNKDRFMYLERSDVEIAFGIGGKNALFGTKTTLNYDYDFSSDYDDAVFAGAPTEVAVTAVDNGKQLETQRPIRLNPVESKVYSNFEQLNDNRSFKTMLAVGYLLSQGYFNAGIFEFGPIEYLYSKNNIQGNRLRIGGRTTDQLSEKLFIEAYVAYGSKSKDLSYFLRPAVSLNGKSVARFPAHYLQGTVQHDIFDPGRGIGFRKGDSFFQSLRSNYPTKWMDSHAYKLEHVIEFGNHVSIESSLMHQSRRAIGDLSFVSSGAGANVVENINNNELAVKLRWAPNEKFYYRNLTRTTIKENYPVMDLQYRKGLKGFWKSNYNYDALRGSISKRFFLNQLGIADATLIAGKVWGTLPYPLLEMPDVFAEEDRHTIDYYMMNSMEFVADEYVHFAFENQMNGFILNKIPLIKKLKLREIWGVKAFYGNLTDRNNPYRSSEVIKFDTNDEGTVMTHSMGARPYVEAKVGLDNVLRILRVEYGRRLTYLGLPNASKDTYRVLLNINF